MLLRERLRDFVSANFPEAKRIYNKLWGAKRYRYLFESIKDIKAKKIMEIGTWDGLRAVEMIKTAQVFHGDQVEYYGFDLFEGLSAALYEQEVSKTPPNRREVEGRLNKLGCRVHLYQGDTQVVFPQVINNLPIMDFIFIDGGHSIETIRNDWAYASRLMAKNTIVIFDDYWNREDAGCKKIVEGIDTNIYKVEILPIQDSFQKDWGTLKINFVKVTLL